MPKRKMAGFEESLSVDELMDLIRSIYDKCLYALNLPDESPQERITSAKSFVQYLIERYRIVVGVWQLKVQERGGPITLEEKVHYDRSEPHRDSVLSQIDDARKEIARNLRRYRRHATFFDIHPDDWLWPNYQLPKSTVHFRSKVRSCIANAVCDLTASAGPEEIVEYLDQHLDVAFWPQEWYRKTQKRKEPTLRKLYDSDPDFSQFIQSTIWKVKEALGLQ